MPCDSGYPYVPIWDVADVDTALLEGRYEAHWNQVASCPKCGIVCAMDWNCDFCGHRLSDCSPRFQVAEPKRKPSQPEFWQYHATRQMKLRERLAKDLERLKRETRR